MYSIQPLILSLGFSRGCGNQNFAWRMECNQCKAPKPEGFGPPPFPPPGYCLSYSRFVYLSEPTNLVASDVCVVNIH